MSPKTTPRAPTVSAAIPVFAPGRRAARGGGGASSGEPTDSAGVSDAGATSVIRPDATRIPYARASGPRTREGTDGDDDGARDGGRTGGRRARSRTPRAARRLSRRLRGQRPPQGLAAVHHARRADRPRLAPRAARRRGRPAGGARHDLAHLLDDQADHLGRGHDALRGGRALALRPGGEVHPILRGPARVSPGDGGGAGDRARRGADARLAPAHAHLGADLWLPAG